MKIALVSFVIEQEVGAGAAAVVQHLAEGLSVKGHQVTLITTHPGRHLSKESLGGVVVYRFCPLNLYWVGHKNKQSVWKKVIWQLIDIWNPDTFRVVRDILREETPDLVHVHKLRGFSPSLWSAAKSAGIPTIIQTCHDYELMSPEGTLMSQIGQWAAEGSWVLRPYQWIRSRLSNSVTAVSAPSHFTLRKLVGRGFFPASSKHVIPNSHGISMAKLADLRSHEKPRRRRVSFLYLGRLEKNKGPRLLCEAFEKCAVHNADVHLDVAGWGSLEAVLRERYSSHPCITFHGPVFGSQKHDLLASCDAVVVPSTYPEIFAIVVAEAYAYGKPVIASRVGGLPEIVQQDITGFLVPPRDVESLMEALYKAALVPERLRGMAQACFNTAHCLSREAVVEQYLSLYQSVL